MTFQGIAAVLAGFIGMAAIVMAGSAAAGLAMGQGANPGVPPPPTPGYLAFDYVLGMVAAIGGGALTTWLAPFAPLGHAMALSVLVLTMAVVCLVSYGDKGPPRWYQAALSVSSAVAVLGVAWLMSVQA